MDGQTADLEIEWYFLIAITPFLPPLPLSSNLILPRVRLGFAQGKGKK
jgi:hypothetical protein